MIRYITFVVRQLSLHSHLVLIFLSRKLECAVLLKSIIFQYLHVIVGHVVFLGFGKPDSSLIAGGNSTLAETRVSRRLVFLLKAHIGLVGKR